MELVIRQKADRRTASPASYPLTDCQGVVVISDRRARAERRKGRCGIEDLEIILAKMAR